MRRKNFKGRCEKRVLGKCAEVCRTYDAIQYALLYPNCSALCDKSSIEQVHYRYEKVAMYLSNSKERSIETAIEKLKKYSYDGCRNVGVCTNAEWGAIQLFTLQDELNPYFQIDFNATDKELFLQFCTALYHASKSL